MDRVRYIFQQLIDRMALMRFDDEVRCRETDRIVVVGDAVEGRFELYEGQEPCGYTDSLWLAAEFISNSEDNYYEYEFFM